MPRERTAHDPRRLTMLLRSAAATTDRVLLNLLPDFSERLSAFASVIARVGLNLQPGQKLLVAEPYELQGVARSAEVIVEAVQAATGVDIEVQWGDGGKLRQMVERRQWRDLSRLTSANAQRMQEYIADGGAILFLLGSQPRLMTGLRMDDLAEFRHIAWQHFGPVAQQLTAGATNWTIAPAPSPAWANFVYADVESSQRLAALWSAVFSACRCEPDVKPDQTVAAWRQHLTRLAQQRDQLNSRAARFVRYHGNGTDLRIALPAEHRWCTAQLTTHGGIEFVANLPTEEIFTAPIRDSANGTMTGGRPINYGGSVIDGIELGFSAGRVVRAHARKGDELLQRLLDTDDGARYLGELAVVPAVDAEIFSNSAPLNRPSIDRLFHHPLLDENAANHVALGDAYSFCATRPNAALNRSLIHFDLPIDAAATVDR